MEARVIVLGILESPLFVGYKKCNINYTARRDEK
jgi:hypothetical protein